MRLLNNLKQLLPALLLMAVLIQPGHAANDPVYTSLLSGDAAGGYDVTAYFSENKPVKGNKKYSTEYMGTRWLFASQENLDRFVAEPEKYAPQYGGYCAWAAAQGKTAKGDPQHWTVYNDKLYLNYNNDIKSRWLDDKDHLISEADDKWPALLDN